MPSISWRNVKACEPPVQSLLAKYAKIYPCFVDCYSLSIAAPPKRTPKHMGSFVDAFFNSPVMWLEGKILWFVSLLYAPTNIHTKVETSNGRNYRQSYNSGFFQVAEATDCEIILDSGPFLTWLAAYPQQQQQPNHTTMIDYIYCMGSIAKSEPTTLLNLLIPFHTFYSKLLLASAVRRHQSHD